MIEPKSYNDAIKSAEKNEWIIAMKDELASLNQHKTWTLCKLPCDRTAVGSQWVFAIRRDEKGQINRYKARLVAQGYSQKFGIDFNQVFAPVAKHSTMHILLSIASRENFIIKHLDVNGKLSETIYMKQPPGFQIEGKMFVC